MDNITVKRVKNFVGLASFCILIIIFLSISALFLISHSSIGISGSDRHFMELAYKEAALAMGSGDYPVGAVLVVNDSVIAGAHNEVILNSDARNHAEMLAINKALQVLNVNYFSQIKGDVTLLFTPLF